MAVDEFVEELTRKVGEETHLSDWLAVDQAMIGEFADVTKDHQWIHVDVDRAAKESPFGSTIAHGFLTLSLIPHLTGVVDPDRPAYPDLKLAVNYGLNRVRFPSPVPANSKVRTRSKLAGVDKINEECFQVVQEVTIEIEGQDKPACVAEVVLRYYF
ncbi:MAG: enoyl-CoA hydratase [SAR202 cluster bacterium Io17-Chloro-G7]|nr:MAG: enoyl-CoA hydratase [SAR202 cluster bacterium Io17-Chloro-G7]